MAALMAVPVGYESGELYSSRHLTSEILSKSVHGVASVSNVNGRGIIVVNAIVRRPRRHSKPMYDYANILGYVGGEIRDGYFKPNLKESEALRMMQMHVDMSGGNRTLLTFAPVEDVAALCVIPMHEKSVAKGFSMPDNDTADAFECLKKVAKHCSYQSLESFFDSNLGQVPRNPDLSKFDDGRLELQVWTLDKEDLMYHNCPLPPGPPLENLGIPGGLGGSFLNFLEQTSQMVVGQAASWRKTVATKFSSEQNYERFCGMAKHQAMWYIWMGDLDRANVMINALQGLQEDQKKGGPLNQKNIVVSIILDLTLCNLISAGLYEGSTTADFRLTARERCDACSSPVSRQGTAMGFNVLTCVDKDGNGEFGTSEMRMDLAKLLFAVNQFGIDSQVKAAANICFEKPFATFLSHAFENLYWQIKPTNPMADATTKDVVAGFRRALEGKSPGELIVGELAESCKTILRDALLKNCASKLGSDDVEKLCDLFQSKFKKVVKEYNKLMKEKSSRKPDATSSAKKIAYDLISNNVMPHLARDYRNTWRFLSSAKKRRLLTAESKLVHQSCREAFEEGQVTQTPKPKGRAHAANYYYLPEACGNVSCACKNAEKLQKHLIKVLSSEDNPVPFYACHENGNIVLNEKLCSGDDGDYYNGMPAFDLDQIFSTIEEIPVKSFAVCPRLGALCKSACHAIYQKFITHLVRGFEELEKNPNPRFQQHTCQSCGQPESELGEFKRCGGCKRAYYCGRKCQAQDWKAGHKQKCKTTARES
ncbi:uncharacterized protein LOC144652468 [Oculina patagonica]